MRGYRFGYRFAGVSAVLFYFIDNDVRNFNGVWNYFLRQSFFVHNFELAAHNIIKVYINIDPQQQGLCKRQACYYDFDGYYNVTYCHGSHASGFNQPCIHEIVLSSYHLEQ
jgi:hypothetical protein